MHRGRVVSTAPSRWEVPAGCVPGGYTGWVLPGPPMAPAASPPMTGESAQTQRSGPGRPSGPGVVGSGCSGVTVGGDGSWTTLGTAQGPVGPLQGPPCPGPLECPPRTNTATFSLFSVKLVKTAKCHCFMSKRPVIVPILKTRAESHLLIFSDFHFCAPSLPRN